MQRDGEQGFRSVHNSFSLLLIPPHTFPLHQCESSPWTAVFQDKPAWAQLLHGMQEISTCSSVLHELQGACPLPPSSLTLVSTALFLTLFSCSLFTSLWCFCPFLDMFSNRHYQLGWQAQPCPVGGLLWSCLDLVIPSTGQPLVSSHRGHPCSLIHCPHLGTDIQCDAFILLDYLHPLKEEYNTVALMP